MGILEEMRDLLKSIDANVAKIVNQNPDPPIEKDWPNKPANFRTLSESYCSGLIDGQYGDDWIPNGDGWKIVNNVPPGTIYPPDYPPFSNTPRGYSLNGTGCYDFVYPRGMRLGTAPSTIYFGYGGNGYEALWTHEVYFGAVFKMVKPFDLNAVGNKLMFIFNGGGGSGGQMFVSVGTDELLHAWPEFPNLAPDQVNWHGTTKVTQGDWHCLEWYTNQESGEMKIWLDNNLEIHEPNKCKNEVVIDMVQLSPTFGGNGEEFKRWEDHLLFEKIIICKR